MAAPVQADVMFQEGFESGSLSQAAWTTNTTNQGRVTVSPYYSPISGRYHLVLDDSSNDSIYSISEAVLHLDLPYKKNVVLKFTAKSLGNQNNPGPTGNFTGNRSFDGVSISTDGGTKWRVVQLLGPTNSIGVTYTVTLDSAVALLGGTFGPGFLISFSQYGYTYAGYVGLAIDDISVTADDSQHMHVDVVSAQVMEGSTNIPGTVRLGMVQATDATLALTASPSGVITIPASVVIPASQTTADFTFSVPDNNLVNFTRIVTLSANLAGAVAAPTSLTVLDDEPLPVVTLAIPARFREGSVSGSPPSTLSITRAAAMPLTFSLSSVPASQMYHPTTVSIPAGQTQAAFFIYADNDSAIDGDVTVTLTATHATLGSVTAQTVAEDNEGHELWMEAPLTLQEARASTGTVHLPGYLPYAVVVTFASSSPFVTVPASMTIQAGSTTATFPITAADNAQRDGSHLVNITASAEMFVSATKVITIRDDEIAGYAFGPVNSFTDPGVPFAINV
ncbi:MAG: hypothetical protein JWO89_311 [Verrucomicrobiaceae bacterium]|nr:hypothetical protein [Verrucomicrobiaceae bacterium]